MKTWTRRSLLAGGLGALAGAVAFAWNDRQRARAERAGELVGMLRDRSAARRVGERLLADDPSWGNAAALRRGLGAALGGNGGLEARAARSIRRDFEAGHTVSVDGWVLSETEARLSALAALSGK